MKLTKTDLAKLVDCLDDRLDSLLSEFEGLKLQVSEERYSDLKELDLLQHRMAEIFSELLAIHGQVKNLQGGVEYK